METLSSTNRRKENSVPGERKGGCRVLLETSVTKWDWEWCPDLGRGTISCSPDSDTNLSLGYSVSLIDNIVIN